MTTDITNFIQIIRQKNGHVKIRHGINNQAYIYEYLYNLGFRQSKLDNKQIYYHRQNQEIKPVNLIQIKNAFHDFLEKEKYTNLPEDITHNDILEWYYSKSPIKENGLLYQKLKDELSEKEAHEIKLKINFKYKHQFEIDSLLSKFNEWKFSQVFDNIGDSFGKGNPLYYKSIGNDHYLVFNHYSSNRKNHDGFDCWMATFADEKHIGIKKPLSLQEIQLSFRLDSHIHIIEQYLN